MTPADEASAVAILVRSGASDALKAEVDAFADQLAKTHEVIVAVEEIACCRVCGCTDDEACLGGCAWVTPEHDLCSSCGSTLDDHSPPASSDITVTCPFCESAVTAPVKDDAGTITVRCPNCAHSWFQSADSEGEFASASADRQDGPLAGAGEPCCPRCESVSLIWTDAWGYRCPECYLFVAIPRRESAGAA